MKTVSPPPPSDGSANLADTGVGLGLAMLSYLCWAMYPFFWKLILHLPVTEVLAHRMVWSVGTVGIVLVLSRQLSEVLALLRNREKLLFLVFSSLMIGANWGIYIYAIAIDHIMEASLGYYLSPLCTVFLSMIFYRERLKGLQYVALGLIACGIAIALIRYGAVPWLGLGLALSFAMFSVLRRRIRAPALPCLFLEVIPPAILGVVFLASIDGGVTAESPPLELFWLVSSGLVTILPLMLYGLAVNRAPLMPVAVLFYVVPTGLFVNAVLFFGETFDEAKMVIFGFVWLGIGLYGVQGLLNLRQRTAKP